MNTPYQAVDGKSRCWVKQGDLILGAVSKSKIRSYLFPLYTPARRSVLQESPADHPHHQGIMVGQDLVNGHNFWTVLMPNRPINLHEVVKEVKFVDETGVTLRQIISWSTVDGQAVLDEIRVTRFEAWKGFHFAEVTSTLKADYGDVYFGQTKEGGLGMRVNPLLESDFGGIIRSSIGATGEKMVFGSIADWIEVCGQVEGGAVGIVMMPHPSQPKIPWFVRGYGVHLYSPRSHSPIKISAGEQIQLRIGFAAYDGVSDGSQAAQAWEIYRKRMDP